MEVSHGQPTILKSRLGQLWRLIRDHREQYRLYATCTILKLLLFYYLATHLPQHEFIGYHVYVYYTDILVALCSAGTLSYLAAQSSMPLTKRLTVAFLSENVAMCGCLGLAAIGLASDAVKLEAGTSFWIVLALAVGRLNTQLMSRYYLFEGQFARSLLNDFASNFVWTVPLLGLLLFGIQLPLAGVLCLWVGFLFGNVGYNGVLLSRTITISLTRSEIRSYLQTAPRTLVFTGVVNNYFGLEKLFFFEKFQNAPLFASYIFLSRVVGMISEFTVNFLSSLTNTKLSQISDRRGTYFQKGILAAGAVYLAVLVGLPFGAPIIHSYFPDRLDPQFLWLATYVVIQAFLYYAVSLNTIYFQRFRLYAFRTATALCLMIGLVTLYLSDLSPRMFLIGQIALFVGIVGADVVKQRKRQ